MAIDKEIARNAASGHWPTVAAQVIGISDDFLTTKHGPCPKCGGTDRWRVFDDFEQTGGAICNQCGKFADGFSLAQWYLGIPFFDAIEKVCDFLGVVDQKKKTTSKKKSTKQNNQEKIDLEFIPWKDRLFETWSATKRPITAEAVKLAGGQFAKHHGTTVLAIPFYGRDGSPSGWALYNASGGTIPWRPSREEKLQHLKIKIVGCKQHSGWAGRFIPGVETIKTEGVSDMLAVLSVNPNSSVITNPFGAGENPIGKHNQWMLEHLRNQVVYTIHDIDEAGQVGALGKIEENKTRYGWANAIAAVAKESRNIVLQFHGPGKDVRDFLLQRSFEDLKKLIDASEIISRPVGLKLDETKESADSEERVIEEAIDSPQRLARVNIRMYSESCEGRLIFWKKQWLKYRDGRWKLLDDTELKAKVAGAIEREFHRWMTEEDEEKCPKNVPRITRNLVSNVIQNMETACLMSSSVEMPCWIDEQNRPVNKSINYLAFPNGILDLDRLQFEDCFGKLSSNWFCMTSVGYEFNNKASCPKWKEYLEVVTQGDRSRQMILQEWAGYMLMSNTRFQRWLILEGEGRNGKTVFMAGLRAMVGRQNCSEVTIDQFGNRFSLWPTVGKMINFSPDIGEIDNVAEGVIKQFVGGDMIMIDRKNKDPISIKPTAKIVAAWNSRPRIKDRSSGMWRRMLIVPFDYQIPENKIIYGMDEEEFWYAEAAGMLNWAIVGMYRLKSQGCFTKSDRCEQVISEYRFESNPAAEFLDIHVRESQFQSVEAVDLYDSYRKWIQKSGYQPLNISNFAKEVYKKFPSVERKRSGSGDRKYIYKGIVFDDQF